MRLVRGFDAFVWLRIHRARVVRKAPSIGNNQVFGQIEVESPRVTAPLEPTRLLETDTQLTKQMQEMRRFINGELTRAVEAGCT